MDVMAPSEYATARNCCQCVLVCDWPFYNEYTGRRPPIHVDLRLLKGW